MLAEEIKRVSHFISAMRDPDAGGELRMNAENADLVLMNLYCIESRVREMEVATIPSQLTYPEPVIGGNVLSIAAARANPPPKRNRK